MPFYTSKICKDYICVSRPHHFLEYSHGHLGYEEDVIPGDIDEQMDKCKHWHYLPDVLPNVCLSFPALSKFDCVWLVRQCVCVCLCLCMCVCVSVCLSVCVHKCVHKCMHSWDHFRNNGRNTCFFQFFDILEV